jgi:hypothetical protein
MQKFLCLFLIAGFTFSYNHLVGQHLTVDTIFSMKGRFKRSKIQLGTDTIIDFKESKGERKINATNTRTIAKVKIDHTKYYQLTTQNIPATGDNITTVTALLDYNDLHLIKVHLSAKTDSAYVEFSNEHFTGWSQLPKEEKKIIDLSFKGLPLLAEGNTPFIIGLLSIEKNKTIVLPVFTLFSNTMVWKSYTILGKESVSIKGKEYPCWKIDAGKKGPPGYSSYHWYNSTTGALMQAELAKEGSDLKFVSELK